MVASSVTRNGVSLFNFRKNEMVWSWTEPTDYRNRHKVTEKRMFRDAIAIEEISSICVVDENECLGFIDFRRGQLFSSMDDRISVYCGSDCALTSELRQSHGCPICGFSIGDGSLFALHSEENVIDVSPPASYLLS
ncbi:hypothetical protein K7X08_015416 [Anisodus acutangulus]|uniref:At2g24240-like C-terminal beta-propeller domain-containing protein n=1 Tax=Anisodus acutangulus TaxID=402998 RepID=A0A9Q1L5U0_9SOLA|nr:hypothetical protein K7X08_015416 [Anisodus acutangulus]